MSNQRPGARCRGRLAPRAVHLHQADAIGHHVIIRLVDDRTIATSGAARRIAASSLCRVADPFGLLAFGIADTHLHVLLAADRLQAGECARRVEISLNQRLRLRARFEPARVRAVESQAHLQRAFLYVLRQPERHGLEVDPAHDGTSLPDLVGLRVGGSNMKTRVAAVLPRMDLAALTEGLELTPRENSRLDFALLRESAAAAFGLGELRRRGQVHHRAHRAATHAASHLSAEQLATLLDTSACFVRRLRMEPPHPHELRAIMLQLSLRTAIAGRARANHEPTQKFTA